MQIVIQQREAQIVADAVAAVFVHPQRGCVSELRLQLAIERSKTAIKPDHEREMTAGGQLNQRLRIAELIRQRFINADMNAGIEQPTNHFIM